MSLTWLWITFPLFGIFIYRSCFRIRSKWWMDALCEAPPTGEKRVALTFDDGIDPRHTTRVLDVLKRQKTPACFFLVGDRLDPALLQRMVTDGHIVGNHTLRHSGWGPFASTARMTREAELTDERIARITGLKVKLFRPPFGVSNPRIGRIIKRRGYRVIGWSIRSLDTLGTPRDKVVKNIMAQLFDGAIILLHDNRPESDMLLEMLLCEIRKEGYKIERVDRLLKIEAYE